VARRRAQERGPKLSYAYRQDLNWLVSDFTARVPDVAHAAVVSADGVPLSLSDEIPQDFAQQLAAITSGLASLMEGTARIFEKGAPTQALVEMEGGLMIVKAISDGSSLCVLASPDCDTELVAYEMSLLVEAAGEVLSPALRGSQAAPAPSGYRRAITEATSGRPLPGGRRDKAGVLAPRLGAPPGLSRL
jgi:predicted regulator of Ras-like GTPase activity (Roadblock/LC7/MglB family)